jgi:hypothetical protein
MWELGFCGVEGGEEGINCMVSHSTQINIQLHQVGKLIHNSNQNARYNYPKKTLFTFSFKYTFQKHQLIFSYTKYYGAQYSLIYMQSLIFLSTALLFNAATIYFPTFNS